MPPIKIRINRLESNNLPNRDIIDSYEYVPVYTYLSKTTEADDINYSGCPYVNGIDRYYFPRNATYDNVNQFIFPVLREPFA